MKKQKELNLYDLIPKIILVFFVCLFYLIHRIGLANEARRSMYLVSVVNRAIERSVLVPNEDYNNVKLAFYAVWTGELKSKYGDDFIDKTRFCELDDDGNLIALLPDRNKVRAEFGLCHIGLVKRAYSFRDKIITKILFFIPVAGWYAATFLFEGVYEPVIYIPEELFDSKITKIKILDAINDPCKYLPDYDVVVKKIDNSNQSKDFRYNLTSLSNVACPDDNLPPFDVKLRIIKNNYFHEIMRNSTDYYNPIRYFPDPGGKNYYEIKFESKIKGIRK